MTDDWGIETEALKDFYQEEIAEWEISTAWFWLWEKQIFW